MIFFTVTETPPTSGWMASLALYLLRQGDHSEAEVVHYGQPCRNKCRS